MRFMRPLAPYTVPALLALLATVTACSADSTTSAPLSEVNNALVNADVATVTVETLGQDVELMRGPGGTFGLGLAAARGNFECTNAGRDGLTISRICTYKDAAGNVQSAYDSLTTASVSVRASVEGTIARERVTMTVDRNAEFTVSGLVGQETKATWNGTGSGTISRVRTTEDGSTRQYDMTFTVKRDNVVIPVPRTATSWPISGTVTKKYTVVITGGPNDGKSVTREVVITFNGTSTPTATINGEPWELDLANRGRRKKP